MQVVKVADFGVARVQTQSGVMTAETGTYRWMAPEVCIFCPFHKCKVWAIWFLSHKSQQEEHFVYKFQNDVLEFKIASHYSLATIKSYTTCNIAN